MKLRHFCYFYRMDTIKKYTHDGVTVVWKPQLCIHSANCVKALPEVFKPKEKPWVQPKGSTGKAIIDAVKRCPSGALTYKTEQKIADTSEENSENIQVNLIDKGPAIIIGNCTITHPDGTTEVRERRASFCRCAKSANFPYCDGSHKNA